MRICNNCNGKGHIYGDDCHICSGTGMREEWWNTNQYKQTGRVPKDRPQTKGFGGISLFGGVAIGLMIYLATHDSTLAIAIGTIITIILAFFLNLLSKHFLAIVVIGYVLYSLFG